MKIDIVYINDELIVGLSGDFNPENIEEVERRINIILTDYHIKVVTFNIDFGIEIDKNIFTNLTNKYDDLVINKNIKEKTA